MTSEESAAATLAAHRQRLHQQWLADENTRKFFRALEFKRIQDLTSAAKNSTRTGLENGREHNKLVAANTIFTIIETYATDTYPYAEFDAATSQISPALGR